MTKEKFIKSLNLNWVEGKMDWMSNDAKLIAVRLSNGEEHILSEYNIMGGVCDCCRGIDVYRDTVAYAIIF